LPTILLPTNLLQKGRFLTWFSNFTTNLLQYDGFLTKSTLFTNPKINKMRKEKLRDKEIIVKKSPFSLSLTAVALALAVSQALA